MTSYRNSHVGEGKGAWYDETHARKMDAQIWEAFIKDELQRQFKRCVDAGARRYLDFACGTGRVMKLASRFFPTPVGIDISPDMLEVARQRVPEAELHCMDVTRDTAEDPGSFEVVTLFRFLLNAEPALRAEVLDWLSRHTRPGAVLIGNNHMETLSLGGVLTVCARKLYSANRNHLSRQDVERMLDRAGFDVEQWSGYRVFPTVLGKPVLGSRVQLAAERAALQLGAGRFGVEQVFVARRR